MEEMQVGVGLQVPFVYKDFIKQLAYKYEGLILQPS